MKCFDRAMEPGKIKLALSRLHEPPGKLGDAHIGEAKLGHHARIFVPQRFRRLVGIIVDAQQKIARGVRASQRPDRITDARGADYGRGGT